MAKKILIVDDDQFHALSLQRQLAEHGFDSLVAFSGTEALNRIAAEHPAIVMLHTRMKGMSGFEVFETIRADWDICDTFVILMTENPTDEEVFRGFRLCSDAHFNKPVDIKLVLPFVERIMNAPEEEPDATVRHKEHMQRYFNPKNWKKE
jgi:DNA-binding response OmpR family regulator